MPAPESSSAAPKVWVAAIGVLGFLVTLVVGIVTLAGIVLAAGVWKGGIDSRVSAVEVASKDQIAALALSTDKQITALAAGTKEMVGALEHSTATRLEAIEHDRAERIQEATRWRAEYGAITAELKTIITQQQKQIDTISAEQSRRTSRP